MCCTLAFTENINVSQIATGTYVSLDWSLAFLNPPANNGATLTYYTTGDAKVGSQTTPYYAPDPWNLATQAIPQYPYIQRLTPLPNYSASNTPFDYDYPFTERATVNVASMPATLQASTNRSGSADTALSYSVRIDHFSSNPLNYFLNLDKPVFSRSVAPAYSLSSSSDYNGGTYSYISPTAAQARATVDVYVNDLPVWSSEDAYLYPSSIAQTAFDQLGLTWGAAEGPGKATLFLGRLNQGDSMTVTVVSKASGNATASSCGFQGNGSWWSPQYSVHCFDLTQTIQMNGVSGQPPAFNISSSHLSPVLQKPGFPVLQ